MDFAADKKIIALLKSITKSQRGLPLFEIEFEGRTAMCTNSTRTKEHLTITCNDRKVCKGSLLKYPFLFFLVLEFYIYTVDGTLRGQNGDFEKSFCRSLRGHPGTLRGPNGDFPKSFRPLKVPSTVNV